MTKKTILGILVLVITGMLCAPVAAELQTAGDWNFFILEKIVARTDVKINGHGDRNAGEFQMVHVPASLDRVDVQFDVTWGPDTKLTITREYIDMLRKKYTGREPAIYAHGCIDTYDVDSGGFIPQEIREYEDESWVDNLPLRGSYYPMTIHEHLAKRGRIHRTPGVTIGISSKDVFYDRFVSG